MQTAVEKTTLRKMYPSLFNSKSSWDTSIWWCLVSQSLFFYRANTGQARSEEFKIFSSAYCLFLPLLNVCFIVGNHQIFTPFDSSTHHVPTVPHKNNCQRYRAKKPLAAPTAVFSCEKIKLGCDPTLPLGITREHELNAHTVYRTGEDLINRRDFKRSAVAKRCGKILG